MNSNFKNALFKLEKYINKQQFRGYDPYDTLNSWVPFHWFGNYGQFAAIQLQKRNPINIRPLIGIKKDVIPKSFALFMHGYSLLYMTDKKSAYREKMDYFFNWFLENKLAGYEGYCWTKNFALTHTEFKRPKVDPSSVLAAFVGEALFEYYNATKNEKAIEVMEGICEFIFNHVPVHKDKDEYCFSYTTLRQDFVHNANLHVAELFAKTYALTKNKKYWINAHKAANYSVRRQRGDGSWSYRTYSDGKEKMQIDFHQGFILNSLHSVYKYTDQNHQYHESIKRGAKFYFNKQFNKNGTSLFRYPKKSPIDIHNQAQGIISFSLLNELDSKYLPFAKKIAEWTIHNMQSKKGYFYYKKYPLFTNKIPYIRWSQAWSFLALAQLNYIEKQ